MAIADGKRNPGLETRIARRNTTSAFVDIVSAQPSPATSIALKSGLAGVAVVTCLSSARLRSDQPVPWLCDFSRRSAF